MQVYANTFKVEGSGAYRAVIGAIHGWLKQVTGEQQLSLAEITRNNEFSSTTDSFRWWLRSFVSAESAPQLYAWRLKHGQSDEPGRQWIIELGVKVDATGLDFSCSMVTDEQSTLVRSSIDATRPRIIGYVLNNVANTADANISSEVPGLTVKRIGLQVEDYDAFRVEIERKDRDFPLVLVSPTHENKYFVNRDHLQDALFGLAQVVEIAPDFDSYEMEKRLGKVWSAWQGAINILQTPRSNGYVHGSLLRGVDIENLGESQASRVSHVLARVTHHTNVPRSRNRVRPEGVMQLALKRRLLGRRPDENVDGAALKTENSALWIELENQEESYQSLKNELDSVELKSMELEDKNQELNDQLRAQEYKATALEMRGSPEAAMPDMRYFVELAARADQPSPEDCLQAISVAYPQHCVILESAWKSARDMPSFQSGRRLLGMLQRLMTDYAQALQAGGDTQARKTFSTNEYSANESETVESSPTLRAKRCFQYNGKTIEMFKHLKIGTPDNISLTLRVHFSWLPEETKIVIGHCGEHLPVASH